MTEILGYALTNSIGIFQELSFFHNKRTRHHKVTGSSIKGEDKYFHLSYLVIVLPVSGNLYIFF